jgi:hypothetical protein
MPSLNTGRSHPTRGKSLGSWKPATRRALVRILKIASREPTAESARRDRGSVMLAQHDVPVQAGQWYRIRLRAKAEGLSPDGVTLALQNTQNWRSLFDYQRFVPQATGRNSPSWSKPMRPPNPGPGSRSGTARPARSGWPS